MVCTYKYCVRVCYGRRVGKLVNALATGRTKHCKLKTYRGDRASSSTTRNSRYLIKGEEYQRTAFTKCLHVAALPM